MLTRIVRGIRVTDGMAYMFGQSIRMATGFDCHFRRPPSRFDPRMIIPRYEFLHVCDVEPLRNRLIRHTSRACGDGPTEYRNKIASPGAHSLLKASTNAFGCPTQSPFQVWLAISDKARLPKIDSPPLRIGRFSQKTLAYEVQEHPH